MKYDKPSVIKPSVIVGRHPHGVVLNPLEYLLDDDGNLLKFDTQEDAIQFLAEHGVTEFDGFVFEETDIKAERRGQ